MMVTTGGPGDRAGGLLARLGGDHGDFRRGRAAAVRRPAPSAVGLPRRDDRDGNLVALRQPRRHFRAEFLVQRRQHAQTHQFLLDVGGGDADQRRQNPSA